MSYSITPDQRVLKDGEDVGFIRDSICYTDSPPKGRGVSTFRAMAGDSELQFKPLPTISAVEVVDALDVPEPVASCDDLAAGILSTIPEPPRSAVLGDRDPEWQRWFIATHGEAAFSAKWPNRKLP